jgi:hypothetical protein
LSKLNEIPLAEHLTLPDGTVVKNIVLRSPKVRDLKLAQRGGGTEADQEIRLMASLCEPPMTPEDMEEMGLADFRKLQAAFQRYLDSPS